MNIAPHEAGSGAEMKSEHPPMPASLRTKYAALQLGELRRGHQENGDCFLARKQIGRT